MVALRRLTPAEYLAIERQAERKSEFFDGFMIAMAGASLNHGHIVHNVDVELGVQLREGPCVVVTQDLRVQVSTAGDYAYPDIVVVCDEPQLADANLDTLLNPTALIEVLSPSTEVHDRGRKAEAYRGIASLREYVLIAQDRVHVEVVTRQGTVWVLTEVNDINGAVTLSSIGCTLSLRRIYAKVRFPARP